MPNAMTRADSLREYLSGAGSAGGVQTDPNAALGNFRSSTEATSMGISITSAIANITVDYASGGNAVGAGSLDCTGTSTIRWKDAGGSYGSEVSITNGETKILEASGRPGAYVRISRTSATNLVTGTATVTLAQQLNNVFGFDDVTSAEATAGDTEYRATIVKNVASGSVTSFKRWIGILGTQRISASAQLGASGSGTITISSGDFSDWPDTGYCHIRTSGGTTREIVYYTSRTSTSLTVPAAGRALLGTSAAAGQTTDLLDAVPGMAIGIDTVGAQASGSSIQTISDENTAPTSVTFSVGLTAATGLNIGTLTAGQEVGIWVKRHVPAGAISTTVAQALFQDSFDAA